MARLFRQGAVGLIGLLSAALSVSPSFAAPDADPRFGTYEPPPITDLYKQTVPFRPQQGKIPVPNLQRGVGGTHTVWLVPFYAETPPTSQDAQVLADRTTEFWQKAVPGMTMKFRIRKAKRLSNPNICDARGQFDEARRITGVSGDKPKQHLAVWVPECPPVGFGSLRDGRGTVWFGGAGQGLGTAHTLAHELGHNMGLTHANVLKCVDAADQQVPLSANCVEHEYADVSDVMGGGFNDLSLTESTLGGTWAAKFGLGRVRIAAKRDVEVSLRPHGAGKRVALLRTKFGTLAFSAAQPAETIASPAGVKVALMTREGSGLLTAISEFDRSATRLSLGDAWDINGTNLRVVLTSLTPDYTMTLRFLPRTKIGTPPAAPALDQGQPLTVNEGGSFNLTWSPSTSPNVISYVVESDGRAVARVPGTSTNAAVPRQYLHTNLRVWAVTSDGSKAASNQVSLQGAVDD